MKPFARPAAFALVASFALVAAAQSPMPKAAFTAKTIAILNDTKTGEVTDGALEQLKRWGHFTVIDDPESADIVLRFDHKTERDGRNTQKTDANGNPTDYGYTMSFSSEVHMRAYLKGSETPFYTTKSSDGKKKGGQSCVSSFEDAWLAER
ncbi:hypothetical protein [Silvibacterium dinghuense]|uniref:Uncharacterized protein n=1 Tax=Silvibacterium dinghuense TaxID=1560006 RepID=A0A4Q1SHX0_9BACT|nr:hypothetical protein [Silvibacterium dinghuense]RXS97174.1 hypothetical protein ESZ00_04465 [Silvibacterium dinghuense]GGG96844.1 hypothetical protein GCM10011586_10070 [Silvibacterium dinghuense]